MKIIPNWKKSWHFYSQKALALITLVSGIGVAIVPVYPKAAVVVAASTAAIGVLGQIGRVIDQTPPPPEDDEHQP